MARLEGPKANQLVKAATEVFHKVGFHRAKVSDITAAAGVAQGTFYLYFPSKDEAFLELLRRFSSDLREAVVDFSWTGITTIAELEVSLRRLLVNIFTVCAEQRDLASLFFKEAQAVSEEAAAIPQQFLLEAELITAAYLADGIRNGQARPMDVETVARAIVGYVLHTVTQTIIGAGRSDRFEELATELLQFELYGVLVRRAEP